MVHPRLESRERGMAAQTYTCAICCDTIHSETIGWLRLKATHHSSRATQEFFAHTACFSGVLGRCIPLGPLFELEEPSKQGR